LRHGRARARGRGREREGEGGGGEERERERERERLLAHLPVDLLGAVEPADGKQLGGGVVAEQLRHEGRVRLPPVDAHAVAHAVEARPHLRMKMRIVKCKYGL
jgi:hypothetical protein